MLGISGLRIFGLHQSDRVFTCRHFSADCARIAPEDGELGNFACHHRSGRFTGRWHTHLTLIFDLVRAIVTRHSIAMAKREIKAAISSRSLLCLYSIRSASFRTHSSSLKMSAC
jgi:hypothetical protein